MPAGAFPPPDPPHRTVPGSAHRPLRHGLLACAALLALTGIATAATVLGTVTDPDGRRVPDAAVHVTSLAGARTAVTDDEGRYRFDGLPAGRYRVLVHRPGLRGDPVFLDVAPEATIDLPLLLRLSAVSESVVVSAAQAETPLSSAPASVTLLTAGDLDRQQIDTLADAVRGSPGLAVARSGTRGALTSVFPRGGESDYTLVLLDGVRMNSFGGAIDLATLAAANVERIEIVRGPQSALFGSDAIGGVVHVVTRRGGPARATALVEGGSDETFRLSGSAAGSVGGWSWGLGAERYGTDGMNGQRAPSGEIVHNDAFRRQAGSVTTGYAARGAQLRGALHAGGTRRGFPGPFGTDPNDTYRGIDLVSRGENDWRAVSASADLPAGSRLALRASGTFADLDGRFVSPFGLSDTESRRATGRVQADVALAARTTLSAGVELLDERARSTFVTGESQRPIPVTRLNAGTFAEARFEAADRALITAGLRVERVARGALEADPNAFAPRPAFPADTLVSANPRVAASAFLRPPGRSDDRRGGLAGWTRLHASAGTGIRPPDALEIAFTDNPSLEPERSRSVDLGVEQALAGGALIVDATIFRNRYDDLIVAVGRSFADASQYRTDNISNARAFGVEVAISARPAARIDVRGAYTFLDTAVLAVDGPSGAAPPPFAVGDPLIRRPRHRATAQVALGLPRWSAFARIEARGRTLDVDPTLGAFGGTVPAAGYAVIDAGGALRAWRTVELFARATNLLDRRYEEIVGFPAVGRALVAGVRVAPGH